MFTFILSILWFIELSLILLCLSYTRCMRSVLITMEVPPAVDARQNFAITAVILIVSFYLSFSDCLTTYITYKRNHYYEEFYFGRFHDLLAFHVELHCSCVMIVYSSRFQLCQLYHIFRETVRTRCISAGFEGLLENRRKSGDCALAPSSQNNIFTTINSWGKGKII